MPSRHLGLTFALLFIACNSEPSTTDSDSTTTGTSTTTNPTTTEATTSDTAPTTDAATTTETTAPDDTTTGTSTPTTTPDDPTDTSTLTTTTPDDTTTTTDTDSTTGDLACQSDGGICVGAGACAQAGGAVAPSSPGGCFFDDGPAECCVPPAPKPNATTCADAGGLCAPIGGCLDAGGHFTSIDEGCEFQGNFACCVPHDSCGDATIECCDGAATFRPNCDDGVFVCTVGEPVPLGTCL